MHGFVLRGADDGVRDRAAVDYTADHEHGACGCGAVDNAHGAGACFGVFWTEGFGCAGKFLYGRYGSCDGGAD